MRTPEDIIAELVTLSRDMDAVDGLTNRYGKDISLGMLHEELRKRKRYAIQEIKNQYNQ